jgi:PadR family transcriptional regulator
MPGRRLSPQLVSGTTTLLVLAVIAEEELYGYEIAQRLHERSSGTFAPSEGTLYPTLHRLELGGALRASWRASDRGPRRRYYKLTEAGKGLLADATQEWTTLVKAVGAVTSGSAG